MPFLAPQIGLQVCLALAELLLLRLRNCCFSPPSSSLKAMERIKLPPAGSQIILGLIPIWGSAPLFQRRGRYTELGRSWPKLCKGKDRAQSHPELPSSLSCCVLWAEGKKRKIQGWKSLSSATDLLCCPQARHLTPQPPCSVASGMECIQSKDFMREILSTHSSLGFAWHCWCSAPPRVAKSGDRSGAWSPL